MASEDREQDMRLTFLSTAAFLVLSGHAHAACYETVPGALVMDCGQAMHGAGSADFAMACHQAPGPPVTVEVPCPEPPGAWVPAFPVSGPSASVNLNLSHAGSCVQAGMKPSNINGQVCASGERRPAEGNGHAAIGYRYGTWSDTRIGGSAMSSLYVEGRCIPFGMDGACHPEPASHAHYCWGAGQKRDHDRTDIVVAYFCE